MIHFVQGDIWDRPAHVRINSVNCVGVMGRGIALDFKDRYPEMYKEYARKCFRKEIAPGVLHQWRDRRSGIIIINFPTKRHWRNPSYMDDIVAGLDKLRELLEEIREGEPETEEFVVTIPALGCGNGGLNWFDVKKKIEFYLDSGSTYSHVYVYEP